jgi:hypothetical protein
VMYCYEFDINTAFRWIGDNFSSFFEPAATLVATFIGAWLAFRYQEKLDKKKQLNAQAESGNRVLFQLVDNLNWLENTKRQMIDPYRDEPGRMLLMRPVFSPAPQTNIDIESVEFLISMGEAELLGELSIERRKFQQSIALESERSRFYLQQVNPALEKSGVMNGQEVTAVQVRAALGDSAFFLLQDLTNHYIDQVDKTIISHAEMAKRLRDALGKSYPGRSFIDFSIEK